MHVADIPDMQNHQNTSFLQQHNTRNKAPIQDDEYIKEIEPRILKPSSEYSKNTEYTVSMRFVMKGLSLLSY